MTESGRDITFSYKFILGGDRLKQFDIALAPEDLSLRLQGRDQYPEWVNLDFFKCPNCTLDSANHPYCPVAIGLLPVVDFFRDSKSYEEADIIIETEDRRFSKHAAIQEGLSSLVGIYMVTSGCPIMAKLKPMVRYHLPFANEDETKYRVMSMYLMAQYLRYSKGQTPDWDMKSLVNIYDDVRHVNKRFCERLANIHVQDASLNALINLDCFAMSVTFTLNLRMLDELEMLFQGYLD